MKKLIILSIFTCLALNSTTEAWHGHHGWHGGWGGWGWHRPYYDYGIGAGLATSALINASRQPDTVIIQDNNRSARRNERIDDLEDENAALRRRLNKLERELSNKR